jgi:hypothetical protein
VHDTQLTLDPNGELLDPFPIAHVERPDRDAPARVGQVAQVCAANPDATIMCCDSPNLGLVVPTTSVLALDALRRAVPLARGRRGKGRKP